jgi:hypothetical protein
MASVSKGLSVSQRSTTGRCGVPDQPWSAEQGRDRLRDREAAVDDPRAQVVTCIEAVLTQPGTGSPAVVDVLGPEHAVDRTLCPAAHPAGPVPEAMVRPLCRLGWTHVLCRNPTGSAGSGQNGPCLLVEASFGL